MDSETNRAITHRAPRLWDTAWREVEDRPLYYISLLVVFLLAGGLFAVPVWITNQRQLSPLEQTLFQLFLVLLTFLFSWILAKRSEERNVLVNQRALARSAVRRISGIATSANRLIRHIGKCKAELAEGSHWAEMDGVRRDLLVELFDGLARQVEELTDNIAASTEDWRDILPEEFAKREEVERRILHAREAALDEVNGVVAGLRNELAKGTIKTDEQIAELKELMAKQIDNVERKLSVKVEQIRADVAGASTAVPVAGSGVWFEPMVRPPGLEYPHPMARLADLLKPPYSVPAKSMEPLPKPPTAGRPSTRKPEVSEGKPKEAQPPSTSTEKKE